MSRLMYRDTLVVALGAFIARAGASACARETGAPAREEADRTQAPAAGSAAEPTAASQAGHAPADVGPGSHEDWCEEHQVPESQCTRCNAQLIAAFKATGDWCEEHGLPESQCLKCNPELKIVRPPPGGTTGEK
jgi:hypothetical protein